MVRFEIDFLAEYSDAALIGELRRIAAHLRPGEYLTKTVYGRHNPRVAHTTVCRRFGGWREALALAGLDHLYSGQTVSLKMRTQSAKQLSNDDVLLELRRVHALTGKPWLTTEDFNTHSLVSEDTIRSRFGTFANGLVVAGIPSHPTGKISKRTDEECFENLAAVWTHFGRPPQYREMFRPPSVIQGKTYVSRWGTWRKTLAAFIDWTECVESKQEPLDGSEQIVLAQPPSRKLIRSEADCREIRPGLRFKVFLRDRFRCLACGRSPAIDLNVVLHADHRLAVANGGKTTLDNLQTLCQDCNLGKGRSYVA